LCRRRRRKREPRSIELSRLDIKRAAGYEHDAVRDSTAQERVGVDALPE
jgi:hypothetical protein